ncbi:hypothetical protein BKE38_07540 [Pseudoroseomonas deserti]|uniref:Uncharacterized protein n=2 Tax=Teichococcus deserti TaxID=1817963 RepID=A0A1V2H6K6_9PROT|nr:hypothetical protein BKE38_07540 [Pseudoroseomonas deserti]
MAQKQEVAMFFRKQPAKDLVSERRVAALAADRARDDAVLSDRAETQAAWNSYGERSTLSMGSYGRW